MTDDMVSAEEAQRLLDAATQPSAECTGVAAKWCPIHGDCTCHRLPRCECSLHADDSTHAEVDASPLRDRAEALARTVVMQHAEVERLTRERDAARKEAQGLRADAEVWRGAAEITAEDAKAYMRATDATIAHLRTALDAEAHTHELDLLRLAQALGFDHEPPSDVDAMVAAAEAQRARPADPIAVAMEALVPLASKAYRRYVGGIEPVDAPVTHSTGGGNDYPRVCLMRSLSTDDAKPWQMSLLIGDDEPVTSSDDRATPDEALADMRETLEQAAEPPPVRWGDEGTMDGDAEMFGDEGDEDGDGEDAATENDR